MRDPNLPSTSVMLDQRHNYLDRKLFMRCPELVEGMKGFHHAGIDRQAFLNGVALLYDFVPYLHRSKHPGKCAVEVAGGKLPTQDWFLNLQILTSGGFSIIPIRA